jgi:hypothetical protein
MVLDPFSTLSLASNIVQFVDFSSKLFSVSSDIYGSASGVSQQTEQMITKANHLQNICSQLSIPSDGPDQRNSLQSASNTALKILAKDCKVTAEELLHALQSLAATRPQQKAWASFRVALATLWKRDKIDVM